MVHWLFQDFILDFDDCEFLAFIHDLVSEVPLVQLGSKSDGIQFLRSTTCNTAVTKSWYGTMVQIMKTTSFMFGAFGNAGSFTLDGMEAAHRLMSLHQKYTF